MLRYVIEYAALVGGDVEHIWRRRYCKSLWRSLCGMLSDGKSLVRTDVLPFCALCERVLSGLAVTEKEEVLNG